MPKMKYYLVFLLSIIIISAFSCGERSENVSASGQEVDYQPQEKAGDEQSPVPPPPPPGNGDVTIERKLIKEGSIEYKVDNLSQAKNQLLKATEKWKGYVGSESAYNTSERNSTTFIIRVPAANFDSLLTSATAGIEHFDRKDITVKDITEEYVDVEARLKTKKDLEQRYIEILKKATTVTEMLEIEREMGALRADIESIEGRLNVLKSQVAFSTLTVTIYEPVTAPSFFGTRIGSGFVNGWNSLLDFFVFIVNLWPFLLLGSAGYVGIRRWRAHRKAK
jgi:hypothetical protein